MADDRDDDRGRAKLAEAPTEIDIEGPVRQGDVAPRRPDAMPQAPAAPGRLAGRGRTLRSMLGFGAQTERAGRHLADLAGADLPQDAISDAEARRLAGFEAPQAIPTEGVEVVPPRRPETLPAIVSRAIIADGETKIVPEWHMVRHLPGYIQSQIRQLGRQVFAPFTDTPIEDIQVLSTISNPGRDVKAVATWIFRNGIRDDEAELDFARIMPGYAAKTQIWNVEGFTFMVVKDFAGHYVYGWPGGRGTRLDAEPAPAMLGRR